MTKKFYALYYAFGSFVHEERKGCWRYTDIDCATRFDSKYEAEKVKKELEASGYPQLAIAKCVQETKIVSFER